MVFCLAPGNFNTLCIIHGLWSYDIIRMIHHKVLYFCSRFEMALYTRHSFDIIVVPRTKISWIVQRFEYLEIFFGKLSSISTIKLGALILIGFLRKLFSHTSCKSIFVLWFNSSSKIFSVNCLGEQYVNGIIFRKGNFKPLKKIRLHNYTWK